MEHRQRFHWNAVETVNKNAEMAKPTKFGKAPALDLLPPLDAGPNIGVGLGIGWGYQVANELSPSSLYTNYARVPVAVARRQAMQTHETFHLPMAPASAASVQLVDKDLMSISANKFVKETFAAQEVAGGPSSRRERCSAKQWRKWNNDLRILGLMILSYCPHCVNMFTEDISKKDIQTPIVLAPPSKLSRKVLSHAKAMSFAPSDSEPLSSFTKPIDYTTTGEGQTSTFLFDETDCSFQAQALLH